MKTRNTRFMACMALTLVSGPTLAQPGNLDISGLTEVEFYTLNSDTHGDSSDFLVPTLEFGIEAGLSEQVNVAVTLLAEDIGSDEQTSLEIDEAVIHLAMARGTLTLGHTGMPFGRYETNALSDPLTLLLGETAESAIIYRTQSDSGLSLAAFLFNGDVDDGEDAINDLGFSIGITQQNWSVGADYISNLGDSDTLGDLDNPGENDDVAGFALHGTFTRGSLSLIIEQVRAMDSFSIGDAAGLQPSASQLEIAIDLGDDRLVALSLSSSEEAHNLLQYETQTALAYKSPVFQHLSMGLQVFKAEDYAGSQDNGFNMRLGLAF